MYNIIKNHSTNLYYIKFDFDNINTYILSEETCQVYEEKFQELYKRLHSLIGENFKLQFFETPDEIEINYYVNNKYEPRTTIESIEKDFSNIDSVYRTIINTMNHIYEP